LGFFRRSDEQQRLDAMFGGFLSQISTRAVGQYDVADQQVVSVGSEGGLAFGFCAHAIRMMPGSAKGVAKDREQVIMIFDD
jgi:hypothetical protein